MAVSETHAAVLKTTAESVDACSSRYGRRSKVSILIAEATTDTGSRCVIAKVASGNVSSRYVS